MNFDVVNSGDELNLSNYLKPMSDKNNKGYNSRDKQSNPIAELCIATVSVDVGDIEGESEPDKDGKETIQTKTKAMLSLDFALLS